MVEITAMTEDYLTVVSSFGCDQKDALIDESNINAK